MMSHLFETGKCGCRLLLLLCRWSGCQIYGPSAARNGILRTGEDGKLLLNQDGSYLALDADGVELVSRQCLFTLGNNDSC